MPTPEKGRLKRKQTTTNEDAESQIVKKTITEEPNKTTQLYPPTHAGTAVVEVRIMKDHLKKTRTQNLMLIAKAVSSLKLGASEMKPRSFGSTAITFPNKDKANDLVRSEQLRGIGIEAFIPRHNTEKIGLIKGIPTDVDVSVIINESISPCKILKAIRLNRRARVEELNTAN